METYHKINALFKRHKDGKKKGRLIVGDWAQPEFGYLANNEWTFSSKIDGTNIRVGFHANGLSFGGRTNDAVIPRALTDYLERTFVLEAMLPHFEIGNSTSITLYGEGYGPKIQGGGRYRDDCSFILFDVLINGFWLSRENVKDIADKLGIDAVPEIGRGTLQDAIDIVSTGITFNKAGGMVRWGSGGLRSRWGDFYEEGIVARPVVELFNNKGQRIICKVKTVDFK